MTKKKGIVCFSRFSREPEQYEASTVLPRALQPLPSILKTSSLLEKLAFSLQLLGSEHHVLENIQRLSSGEVGQIKQAFVENKHPRFKKEFAVSRHQPFGKISDYIQSIENANSDKMVKLIRLFGTLLQTKTYLFWRE